MPQGFPLTPSTGVMVSNACSQTNKDDFQEDRTRMLCNVECSTQKYEFGKSMHEYAKKLEKRGECKHKDMPSSKSDGNLCDKQHDANHVSNSKSHYFKHNQKHHSHHQHQHQQCCSGFGSSNRSRFQSNACSIV